MSKLSADWQKPEDNIAQQLCAQVQAYLGKLQDFFVKQIDGKIFAKVCATRLVTIYLERFIYYIKMVYGKDDVLKKFTPVVYRPTMTAMKLRTPERERLEKRLEVLKSFGRDYEAFEAFINENNQVILPSFAKEVLEHWELLLNLIRLDASDFVDGCKKYRKIPYIREAAEAILCIRRDISKEAIKLITIILSDDAGDDD